MPTHLYIILWLIPTTLLNSCDRERKVLPTCAFYVWTLLCIVFFDISVSILYTVLHFAYFYFTINCEDHSLWAHADLSQAFSQCGCN